ncbi:MAG TPA: FAD-binding protein [Thermoleophilaceae bacterium]|nr:FAD-binding protein [Thermoleophilaceae bacterium]
MPAHAIHPDDAGWDEARRARNLAVDQRPDLVVVPESAEEVAGTVRHAAENDLAVAVQGRGHAARAHAW